MERKYFVCCSLLLIFSAITLTTAFTSKKEDAKRIKTLSGREITVAAMDVGFRRIFFTPDAGFGTVILTNQNDFSIRWRGQLEEMIYKHLGERLEFIK